MADAVFSRWPWAPGLTDREARALFDATGGWPLRSVEGEEELALLRHDGQLPATPAGGAHYRLEQVSDTGPASEPFGVIMLVAFNVPADRAAEVDHWYDEEHIDLLMKADGWLRARRYRVQSHGGGPQWTSMAFHELRDISVMASRERAFARSTAWRAELEKESWFPAAGRGVFRPLAR
ncbi:DUF4286 family protein [Sphingobium sp.]|uniref:DUF4286 family protein n=1 Tax=Sphingobium sp. TaxID=1912891 RepID=UPI0028BE7B50|nr:DUF4286 family protein [Sphingobium sp.]